MHSNICTEAIAKKLSYKIFDYNSFSKSFKITESLHELATNRRRYAYYY